MEIVPGVYETQISQAIEEKLAGFPNTEFLIKKARKGAFGFANLNFNSQTHS